ncbi:MAG: M14 family metallopeptidase [Actinomycetota bacterium]
MVLPFDRYVRFDELTAALQAFAAEHAHLVTLEQYGTSFEGRPLWLVAMTDAATGEAHTKPAYWVDANIHAVEVTGGAAALYLLHHLATASERNDAATLEALRTRTFYVVPRVNPDGVEAALADSPVYRRSSMRPWPWRDRHQWPGLVEHDINGDGRVLTMRIVDPNGAWMPHADDQRVMVPVPVDGVVAPGVLRYRLLAEGTIEGYDGFTVPLPRAPESLDMNRNFPAGWGSTTRGAGEHPLSEPEIDALVRAVVARPNVCGYNAFHTSGGVLLRPSSTHSDSSLPSTDVWVWKELGARGTALTSYPVHSVYEDFTWDKTETMSGAADDWAYEHLGLFGWTTEFWDVVFAATGVRSSTDIWYIGPSVADELAIARWCDSNGGNYLPWEPFDHPQLGRVEIGGMDWFNVMTNPPLHLLVDEIKPHADFAVFQALASPCLEIISASATPLADGVWQVDVAIANTGWLPTQISAHATKNRLVLPVIAELALPAGAEIVGGVNRVQLGQLEGRSGFRIDGGSRNDGTPDRALARWLVRTADVAGIVATASHQRAGSVQCAVVAAG